MPSPPLGSLEASVPAKTRLMRVSGASDGSCCCVSGSARPNTWASMMLCASTDCAARAGGIEAALLPAAEASGVDCGSRSRTMRAAWMPIASTRIHVTICGNRGVSWVNSDSGLNSLMLPSIELAFMGAIELPRWHAWYRPERFRQSYGFYAFAPSNCFPLDSNRRLERLFETPRKSPPDLPEPQRYVTYVLPRCETVRDLHRW